MEFHRTLFSDVKITLTAVFHIGAIDVPPKALRFSGSVTEFGISQGSPALLTAISACFWMNAPPEAVSGQREPSILSYAVPEYNNEFLVYIRNWKLTIWNGKLLNSLGHVDTTYV